MKIALYVLACVLQTALLVAACASPEQQSAAQELAETVTGATKDGLVTQDEADAIGAKMKAYQDAPRTDWAGLAAMAMGTLTAGFFGLRYLPNRHIIGAEEAGAVEKAAGLST